MLINDGCILSPVTTSVRGHVVENQGADDLIEAGIPSDTRWVLANGFGSIELPLEAGEMTKDIGEISYTESPVRPGLAVYTFTATIRSPVTIVSEIIKQQPHLWIAINLSGHNEYSHGSDINGVTSVEHSYFAMLRDPLTRLNYPAGEHGTAGMLITPARLRDMLQGQSLCRPIDDFLGGNFDPSVAWSRSTAALVSIANQIARHPYHGVMASVFLEAKAFEMVAETLLVLGDDNQPTGTGRSRRYALAARDIIMANLASPLRIDDVAKQVGLSQRRLNEVFQDAFGASPLRCLVDWRLDLARQILATDGVTVTQVAHQLGYVHVSNFSLAFARRFGCPPTRIDGGRGASLDRRKQ
jgi:AraC-like DNA-binding protein